MYFTGLLEILQWLTSEKDVSSVFIYSCDSKAIILLKMNYSINIIRHNGNTSITSDQLTEMANAEALVLGSSIHERPRPLQGAVGPLSN